jgi:phage terminase large subunit-like protein
MSGRLPFNRRAAKLLEGNDPAAFAKFMEILQLEKLDAERELYENSLLAFFERAWREIDPAVLNINWHHEVICDKLELIALGEIRNCVINIPGRHTKSTLVNIILPSWIWCQPRNPDYPLIGPQVKFLCVSYGATLSEEIALKQLRLVMGEWYQNLWGHRVKIRMDQMSRANFANMAGGERISTSIEGAVLGRGGDIMIIDDPMSPKMAESELERESAMRALSEGLMTRVTDPRIAARIMIMQRLHENDPTDWALDTWPTNSTVHVMLPSRFDTTRACPDDRRTEDGELLWPEVYNKETIDRQERELGPYAFASQHQQMPSPRGGGIIKRDWWQPWPELGQDGEFPIGAVVNGRIQPPAFEYIVAWVDTAFTEKNENDPCAMTVWGLFRAEGKGRIDMRPDGTFERVADDWGYPKVMLIYGWAKRLALHGLLEEIPYGIDIREWNGPNYRELRQANWGLVEWVTDTCKRYKVDHVGIETQAAGIILENEMRRLHAIGDWGVEIIPAKGSKAARVHSIAHLFANKQVYAPTYEDGTHPTWCEPIITQVTNFRPNRGMDDYVDTMTGALIHLRSIGLFERREEFAEEELHMQEYERNRQLPLPYGLG